LKKKRQAAEADVAISSGDIEVLMVFYVKDNTPQDKCWIFDSASIVYVFYHKEMFKSLVVKVEGIVKIVDGSTCKVIDTGTVNVTCRDGTVRALEAVRHFLEAMSIRVLDKEECRIKVHQGIVTVSQEDMVILKGEKCEGIYKLKEENSVRDRVSGINLERSSPRGGASRKPRTEREWGQSVTGKRNGAFRQSPKWPTTWC